ncbi:DUF2007 domain-containing protein, partial [Acinetobacter pittii]|nr:DUF2007 domain-containing protein [Acinetobacter pittii]
GIPVYIENEHTINMDWFYSKECCPECGSLDIEVNTKGKKSAFLAFMFFGLPLFSFKNGNRCKRCGHFWN